MFLCCDQNFDQNLAEFSVSRDPPEIILICWFS